MDLSNEKSFEHLFLVCVFLGLIFIGCTTYILNKKRINVSSRKIMLSILLPAIFLAFMPFWLKSSLSWQFKVFVPLISTVIAIIYGLGIIATGKKLRSIMKSDENISKK